MGRSMEKALENGPMGLYTQESSKMVKNMDLVSFSPLMGRNTQENGLSIKEAVSL